MALYRAVRIYHRHGEQDAFDQLETDLARLPSHPAVYLDHLGHYIDAFKALGNTAFQYPLRVSLDIGAGIAVGGEIARVDLVPGGTYAAWLMRPTPKPRRWQGHLNMPLLQKAVADEIGAQVADVSIGYYWFVPDEYSSMTYTGAQIRRAVDEATRLAVEIARHLS